MSIYGTRILQPPYTRSAPILEWISRPQTCKYSRTPSISEKEHILASGSARLRGYKARYKLYHRYRDYNHSNDVGFSTRRPSPDAERYLPNPFGMSADAWDSKARRMISENMAAWNSSEGWRSYWLAFDVFRRIGSSFIPEVSAREVDRNNRWYRGGR
jgi:hypothetical protein